MAKGNGIIAIAGQLRIGFVIKETLVLTNPVAQHRETGNEPGDPAQSLFQFFWRGKCG